MTANTYLHAVESLQQDAVARIETMLGNAVGSALTASGESAAKSVGPQRAHAIPPQL